MGEPYREVEHHMPSHSVHLMNQVKKSTPPKRKKTTVTKMQTKKKPAPKRAKPAVVEVSYRPRAAGDD